MQVFTLRGDGLLFSESLLLNGFADISQGVFGSLDVTHGGMTVTGGVVVR